MSCLAVLVLDSDASRLAVKYSSASRRIIPTAEDQFKFEKKVVAKLPKSSKSTETDIALIGDLMVLYQCSNDVYVCIVASPLENEIMLADALEGLYSAIQEVTQLSFVTSGTGLAKANILEVLDQVMLVLDEVMDDGILMEITKDTIVSRLRMINEAPPQAEEEAGEDMAVFKMATQAAKKRLMDSLLGYSG